MKRLSAPDRHARCFGALRCGDLRTATEQSEHVRPALWLIVEEALEEESQTRSGVRRLLVGDGFATPTTSLRLTIALGVRAALVRRAEPTLTLRAFEVAPSLAALKPLWAGQGAMERRSMAALAGQATRASPPPSPRSSSRSGGGAFRSRRCDAMAAPVLMVLNAGSSSLKFQIFEEAAAEFRVVCKGLFEGLGGEGTSSSGRAPARTSTRWIWPRTRRSVTSRR